MTESWIQPAGSFPSLIPEEVPDGILMTLVLIDPEIIAVVTGQPIPDGAAGAVQLQMNGCHPLQAAQALRITADTIERQYRADVADAAEAN